MEAQPREIVLYETVDGSCPWLQWFNALKDRRVKATIDARLLGVQQGNFGNCRGVGDGVSELKINLGPGYRIYFRQDDRGVALRW